MEKINLSIIVPVYNEEENIPILYGEIKDSIEKFEPDFEIIFINDGSHDNSLKELKALRDKDKRVKIIDFRKNFGQTAALAAGFDYAEGEIMITMDGDLQNNPKDIPMLIKKMKDEDLDIVNGWRYKRKDPFVSRKLPSIIANKLISWITGVKLHDYGCTLKVYRKDIAKDLKLYGEQHRFIPALAHIEGAKVGELKVDHRERRFGKSKYGISRTIRVILDLITVKFLSSYSTKPLQIFGLLGFITGGIGVLIGLYLAYIRLILKQGIAGRPLLFLSMLLIFMGVQFFSLGIIGEMLSRTYHESSKKKVYRVKKAEGFDSEKST
jgi:glycosyltransferase involved in cell wall biosynthesis